jgi:hypothetical protein
MPKSKIPAAGEAMPAEGQPDDTAEFAHEIYERFFKGRPREEIARRKAFLEDKFPRCPEGAPDTRLVDTIDDLVTIRDLVGAAWAAAPDDNPVRALLDVIEDRIEAAHDRLNAYHEDKP